MKKPPEKPPRVDVIKGYPVEGPIIWMELNEVDTRLLCKGMVSEEVRGQAQAAMGWAEDKPWLYTDEDFLKLGRKAG